MDRRMLLAALAGSAASAPLRAFAADDAAPEPAAPTRLAAAWRGLATDSPQRVGALAIDWSRREVLELASTLVPSRAHGLIAEPGGGWLAVAFRPGSWLWRFDARGDVVRRASTDDEPGARRFCGHVVAHPDGRTLLTTEYDARTFEGRIGVRDRDTLRKLDDWPSGGLDPHQLAFDAQGRLLVANGGLPRTPEGAKRDLDRMDSSLVLLDPRDGAMLGRWRPPDARLGLRHLAWSAPAGGAPLLGIALQAEHDDPARRAQAPVLATWDGRALSFHGAGAGGGYAGDIAPAPDGFVLSCQPSALALHWSRARPDDVAVIARLREACALAPVAALDGAVVVAGALGVGRWHHARPAALLRWPAPIALDNHWVELDAG